MLQVRFQTLIGYVTPYRSTMLAAGALMLGESAASLAGPWLAGHFTQAMLQGERNGWGTFNTLLLAWLGLIALQSLFRFGNSYLLASTGARMLTKLRMRLYDHLQSLPLGYFHQQRRGDLLSLLTHDAGILSRFVTGTLVGMLPLTLTFCGALYLMFRIDAGIALTAAVLVPLLLFPVKLLGQRLRPLSAQLSRGHAGALAQAEENLAMLPVIKAFTREQVETERYRAKHLGLLQLTNRQLRLQSVLAPVIQFLAGCGVALLLWLANQDLMEGALDPAQIVTLLLYGLLLVRPVSQFASVYGQIQSTRGAAERLIDIFSVAPEPEERNAASLLPPTQEIRFKEIVFHYPDRDEILQNLNLTIRVGETLAVTGPNGAGKSTLAHLLLRFADPQEGRIVIDGTDIRSVSLDSLRRQIGLISQQVLLFNSSVADNIGYGDPEATPEQIEAAAREACALDFITHLPDGFDTLIGDRGVRLSGGQKQRIALARALLKDPPVLILDEATAMFDPEGEEDFIHRCRELMRTRTVILITHRPASLALADRVVRLENGRIIEAG